MPFVKRPDARIWWDQSGTGDPILLIMGHTYGADMWHRTAPELAAAYRVIRFDNRGAGRSSDPPGPYPVPLMAEDALAVLDAAGAASAHVYGVSMGGFIALQLALDHPGRVRSLVLGCTAASAEGASSFAQHTSRAGDPQLHEHNLVLNLVPADTDGKWRRLDSKGLYRHKAAFSAIVAAELERMLTARYGVAWVPGLMGTAGRSPASRTRRSRSFPPAARPSPPKRPR